MKTVAGMGADKEIFGSERTVTKERQKKERSQRAKGIERQK